MGAPGRAAPAGCSSALFSNGLRPADSGRAAPAEGDGRTSVAELSGAGPAVKAVGLPRVGG